MNVRKAYHEIVPRDFDKEQKLERKCFVVILQNKEDPDILSCLVTCIATWLFHYKPEIKQHTMK
jgi:hypothetical protein